MSRDVQLVQIGKRKVELSNLTKELYPDDHVIKAAIIEYYLKVAPTLLQHIKGRPLSLIRFPDGIDKERFFQKNRPKWAPDWIEYEPLGSGKEKKEYIIATEEASLVWLANLACLELHEMHSMRPHYDKPDYIVYDLDPPEGYDFTRIVELAFDLKEHLEAYGYHTFVKTTGGKGVHILTPVEPKWDFSTTFEAAQDLAKPFVQSNKTTTLHIKKDARKGRVLIDIYRNRPSQTIIAPYSLRGSAGAPVSMPIPWERLKNVSNPKEFNIHNALDILIAEGDAWEGFAAYAVPLHTKQKGSRTVKKLKPSDRHKTPEQLETYSKKRDFKKTSEPRPDLETGLGNGFVIHRHHASHLHYDLRLEKEGTLKSWAVPRGMPPRPGIKRLAVATEDHPMKYLNFEGTIPKGQYGGGDMWIFSQGRYEITKEKKNGFYFKLSSKELSGEFRMHLMKGKEWLLERVDNPQIDWTNDLIEPMLATLEKAPPESDEYIYEVKWDGIRAIITVDEGKLTIRSRNQRDITKQFPELNIPEQAIRANATVLDCEIVCLEDDGRPNFKNVIHRLMQSTERGIERGQRKNPAISYVLDCLYLDGRPIINEPLTRRREWMADAIRKNTPYRVSEAIEDGVALFEATKKMGLEGIMAKIHDSRYLPGKRSNSWLKIKVRQTADCLIIGYTKGKGNRDDYFGALHLGEYVDGALKYRGKVGTGFNEKTIREVFSELKGIKKINKLVKEKPVDHAKTTWIEPKLMIEIQYASITNNDTYREPVFVSRRPDLDQ